MPNLNWEEEFEKKFEQEYFHCCGSLRYCTAENVLDDAKEIKSFIRSLIAQTKENTIKEIQKYILAENIYFNEDEEPYLETCKFEQFLSTLKF